MARTEQQIIEQVNHALKKFKRNATCINPKAGKKWTNNLVIIKCLDTNRVSDPTLEISIKRGHWPFGRSDEQIINEINQSLKEHKRNAVCVNPRAGKQGSCNLVTIKCLETNRISDPVREKNINASHWPFGRSDEQIINEINQSCKKHKWNSVCINPRAGKDKHGHVLVIIKCLDTNRVSRPVAEGCIKRGDWPFERSNDQIINEVNLALKEHKRNAVCVNPRAGKQGSCNLVTIKCLETNRISDPVQEGNIKSGSYTFNEDQDRVELTIVHPMYRKLFKKHNIKYEYNFELGSKIIDFVFEHPITKKWYGLEVKQSDKWHSEKGQISGYKKLSSLKQYGLASVILSDPKGSHKKKGSISIKELEEQFLTKQLSK